MQHRTEKREAGEVIARPVHDTKLRQPPPQPPYPPYHRQHQPFHVSVLEAPLPVPCELTQARDNGVWIADDDKLGIMHYVVWLPAATSKIGVLDAVSSLPANLLATLYRSPNFNKCHSRVLVIQERALPAYLDARPGFVAVLRYNAG